MQTDRRGGPEAMSSIGASRSEQRLARRAVVIGRVQGVWFRDSTRRRAQALGVAGWARNCADGSVEVWAEGPPEAVDGLLRYCRAGPPGASVQEVRVEEVEPAGWAEFEVR
jgi:acylphosphatase